MFRRISSSVLAFTTLSTLSQAGVLVVAPSGAPFTTIQPAIDAAVDGDVILVKPGTYGGFTLSAKALALVSDTEGAAHIAGATLITNVGVGRITSLSGFAVSAGDLTATNCAGSLRFEALTSDLPSVFQTTYAHALLLSDCADVAILRCSLQGSPSYGSFPSNPGQGLAFNDSNVAVYDSSIVGGKGSDAMYVGMSGSSNPPLSGAKGCEVVGTSRLLLAASTITGGEGGAGLPGICFPAPLNGGAGAIGGIGLDMLPSVQAYARASSVQGGPGGAGGSGAAGCGTLPGPMGPQEQAVGGVLTNLPGTRRALICATHVRELNMLNLTLEGQPGDIVVLNLGTSAQWMLDLPLGGVRLVGLTSRRVNLGVIPGSGALNVGLPIGDLGAGVDERTYQLQAYFRDISGGTHAGSGAVLVALDAAF